MIFKYVRLWELEKPCKLPWNARLKIDYNKNFGRDPKNLLAEPSSDPFYLGYFEFRSGKLGGERYETKGKFDCKVYNTMDGPQRENVKIVKDWGSKELRKIYVFKVLSLFNRLAVELAVRAHLKHNHKQNFYSGFPFITQRWNLSWKGKAFKKI